MTGTLSCSCGEVRIDVARAPILSAECHCDSCRAAGARLEALPGAPRVRLDNGGTHFVLYRKDRVRFATGGERLREFRLTPKSKTRRVAAACCNTPLFLEFQGGHWLSLYAGLWPEAARPAPEMRTMTSNAVAPLPDDMPNARHQSPGFMAKLLGAWIAMGFRSPKIEVGGQIDA
ncbi:MAG: DUF6151 family protein [Mesorhizobium sp.]|nr:DUF6151 family protein [Mesorhizobium sp.]